MSKKALLKVENIASQVVFVRGEKVLLDYSLAALYAVQVKALKQQVRRNIERFPEDFMFELSREEWSSLRSQLVHQEGKPRKKIGYKMKHNK